MNIRRLLSIGFLAVVLFPLVSCSNEAIVLLDAATAAAESLVPAFTSDPQIIACANSMAGGLDKAAVELESADSAAVKAQKIASYLDGPVAGCSAIAGLSPRGQALVQALVGAVNAFLTQVGAVGSGPTPLAAAAPQAVSHNAQIDAIRIRLAALIIRCKTQASENSENRMDSIIDTLSAMLKADTVGLAALTQAGAAK